MTDWWNRVETEAEWNERWRLEREREVAMLAYHDQVGGRITQKALAEQFNLTRTRASKLVRDHVAQAKLERMHHELDRLKKVEERLTANPGSSFCALAERLWMDLGWLAGELEKRRGEVAGGSP